MTDVLIVAIIAAIPAIIGALDNARRSKMIAAKADAIHELTNSNLTAVQKALERANRHIESLEKRLLEREGTP